MKNDKIVFLILHYKTINETIECVESIERLFEKDNYEVVIVDNGSKDEGSLILKEKYKDKETIHIIVNEYNIGFAKGNNIGFYYAKENLKADYIVMINNDIVFINENFCKQIIEKYNKYTYAILGPKIILKNNKVFKYKITIRNKRQQYIYIILLYFSLLLGYIRCGWIFNIAKTIKQNTRNKKDCNMNIVREMIPLHGACLIFSRKYIDIFDGIDDRTFLYGEENLLYNRIIKNNLISIYDPEIEVLHKQSSTIKSINKTKYKTEIFKIKNLIKSNKIILEEIKRK